MGDSAPHRRLDTIYHGRCPLLESFLVLQHLRFGAALQGFLAQFLGGRNQEC